MSYGSPYANPCSVPSHPPPPPQDEPDSALLPGVWLEQDWAQCHAVPEQLSPPLVLELGIHVSEPSPCASVSDKSHHKQWICNNPFIAVQPANWTRSLPALPHSTIIPI